MKLLVCKWEAYMQKDLCSTLRERGIEVSEIEYRFVDYEIDDYFEKKFVKVLDEDHFDGVVTINYCPIISRVCHSQKIPYIAWVCDCLINVREPEKTLGFSTNHVFLFDRNEYNRFHKMGFESVHHLELAVNVDRLDEIHISEEEHQKYDCDISFVGSINSTSFDDFYSHLGEYEKGFVNGVIGGQTKVYGGYFLNDVISKLSLPDLQKKFEDIPSIAKEKDYIFYQWARHIIASEITRREQISVLSLLSRKNDVRLYTQSPDKMLPNVHYYETSRRYEETPKINHCSRINLNITQKEITSGIPLRVFDIMGAGGFVLTNWQPEIAENFVDGEEVVMYNSVEDAACKATYYLEHEEERKRIAENGRRAVERFSYQKQVDCILSEVFGEKEF